MVANTQDKHQGNLIDHHIFHFETVCNDYFKSLHDNTLKWEEISSCEHYHSEICYNEPQLVIDQESRQTQSEISVNKNEERNNNTYTISSKSNQSSITSLDNSLVEIPKISKPIGKQRGRKNLPLNEFVRVSNKKIVLLQEQHDEQDCPKKRQKLRNRISALRSRINQRKRCKGFSKRLDVKDQRRTEFIHEILVPRLSQHPELMQEILSEVHQKLLGKRPLNQMMTNEAEIQELKIEPDSKVTKPVKIWDMNSEQPFINVDRCFVTSDFQKVCIAAITGSDLIEEC